MGEGARLAAGTAVGRFVVTRLVGKGGMGEVYEALDPQLHRSVALKVLAGEDGSSARLLREAQALARLAHPNVVSVHDVGVADDRVFIAMEFVDGETLDAHLRGRPRRWPEILALLVQAARGLAAAHERGIVHRDFKPGNVLVDRRGRVRVTDFGLARLAAGEPDDDPEESARAAAELASGDTVDAHAESGARSPALGLLGARLTGAGALVGTPRYMAPEQLQRKRATPKSDQYAFCLVLWEALAGDLPPARPARAPRWLVRALEQGLARDPAARHASVAQLLRLLEATPARRRRLGLTAGALVLAAGAAGAFLLRGPAAVDCDRAGAQLGAAWSDGERQRLRQVFAAARPYGAETAERVARRLDDYGRRWQEARVDACRATHERGEESPQMLDRRAACLEEDLVTLRALAAALAAGDGAVVDRALDAAERLPPVEACSAASVAREAAPRTDPPAAAIRVDLARARVAHELGHPAEAETAARAALAAATALGDDRLRAAALALHGRLIARTAGKQARAELGEALEAAVRLGEHELNAEVALALLAMENEDWAAARVESLLPMVRAAVAGAGPASPTRLALTEAEGLALLRLGRFDEALAACDRVEPRSPLRAVQCRCAAASARLQAAEAVTHCRRVVELRTEVYGPRHPEVAQALSNLATALSWNGDTAGAIALMEQAMPIFEAQGESRQRVSALGNLGTYLIDAGRGAEGLARYEQALAMMMRVDDHPSRVLAGLHVKLAAAKTTAGDRAAALRHADEGLRLYIETGGAEHPQTAFGYLVHGMTYLDAGGDVEVALRSFRRGQELAEKGFGPGHPAVAVLLAGQARCLAQLGRAAEGLPLADRALAIATAARDEASHVAYVHQTLGVVRVATGDRSGGRKHLAKALEMYRQLGRGHEAELKETEKLLALAHR